MKLKSKFTIGMLAVALIPLSISMGTLFLDNVKNTQKLTFENATQALELYTGEISAYFSQRITEVKTYARTPIIRSMKPERFLPFIKKEINYKGESFEKFIIGRPDGYFYNSAVGNPYLGGVASFDDSNPNAKLKSISKRDYWLYTVGENQVNNERSFVSNPMISYTTGKKQIVVATSILDNNDNVIGMLGGSLSWDKIEQHINILRKGVEENLPWDIRIFLISPEGIYWYHWDKSKIVKTKTQTNGEAILDKYGEKISVQQKITDEKNSNLEKIGHRMMNGERGFATFMDKLSNEKFTIFYAPVKNTGYSLGIQVPYSQINEPVVHQIRIQSFAILVAVLLVLFVAIFLSRKIAGPISLLRDAADEVAIGNWNHPLPEGGNDEVSDLTRSFYLMITSISETRKILQDTIHELIQQKDTLDHHAIVSIADRQGNITYINDKFCEISGFSREELIGKNHRMLKSDKHSEAFYKNIWNTISQGSVWQGKICNKRNDNSVYWVESTISPFLDDMGIPYQYVSIRTDITNLLEAKLEAEEANLAKSEFLSSMSHELRTPLHIIMGFSQVIKLNRNVDESVKLQVSEIYHAGEHLSDMVNNVLNYTKVNDGDVERKLEAVSLDEILHDCLLKISSLAKQKNINVIVQPSCNEHIVLCDRYHTQNTIDILVSNAVKYNHEGGEVNFYCEYCDNNFLQIIISDTGAGIDPLRLKEMFEPFNRLDQEGMNISGSGLGLSIAKKLIEAMGGEVGVKSIVGEGSQFWIKLPLANLSSLK